MEPETAPAFRLIRFKHEGLKNKTSSFYLSNGHQTRSEIEKCIRSLWGVSDPLLSVTGIVEVEETPEGEVEGSTIPLELLEVSYSLIDEKKFYRPLFFTPQLSDGEGAVDYLANHFKDASLEENAVQQQQQQQQQASPEATTEFQVNDPWQNWEYFYQYGKLSIHHDMLKDEYRTGTYKTAIMSLKEEIKDKVVMDLGCGTGILSFFCVQAGAARVYAIEASDLADWTELVVASNGLADKIKVIKGRIEEIKLPEQVDVIVSEWMGTFLIFESMMESLLYARNVALKSGGLMLPSHANIFLSPVTMEEFYTNKVEFWREVYGVDMTVLMPFAKKCAFEKPIIDHMLKPENVLATPKKLRSFDLSTVSVEEPYQKTTVDFEFKASKAAKMHGFAAWFDVSFCGTSLKEPIVLSTSPEQKETHWKQMLLLFDTPIAVEKDWTIKGTIRYQRNPELLRHLILDISFSVKEITSSAHHKKFFLWGTE